MCRLGGPEDLLSSAAICLWRAERLGEDQAKRYCDAPQEITREVPHWRCLERFDFSYILPEVNSPATKLTQHIIVGPHDK